MENLAFFFKALGDPTRLRILSCLKDGELCVCNLMEALDMPQSTISRHLATLRHAGLVSGRRGGKWMYYQLAKPDCPLCANVQNLLVACDSDLHAMPQALEDALRLRHHLETESTTTCAKA